MADITMRVRANVSQAQKSFEDLADSSEDLRREFEKFAKKTNDATLDEFTEKQRRLQTAITATRGEKEALTRSVANYDRKIQQLIRDGLAPNSEQIRRLRGEQEALQKRLDASRKAQERKTKAMKAAKKAIKASAVAVAGVVAGVIALTKRNATLANNLANSARVVGLTTEAYQELDYAMRMSGVENGEYMLNRLNRSVIDVRNETGTLTKFLEDNYYELLKQLQGVENNEEAFTLLMDAIHRAPNEFAAAELAMAAFGRNGAHMVLVAQNGAEGINALREEARELGVVSNANAQAAMQFNDAMFRLRTSVQNMTQELTVQLLPALTNVVVRLTNVIQRAGEFRARLQGLTSTVRDFIPHIGAATVGITTFIGLMKYKGTVKSFTVALKGLTTAIKSYNKYKKISTILTTVWTAIKTKGISLLVKGAVACAAAVATYATLNKIMKNITVSTHDFSVELEKLGELESFKFLAEDIADLDVALTELAWGGARAAVEAIEEVADAAKKAVDYDEKSLRARLELSKYTANQESNYRINTIKRFLLERAKLESDDREERKEEVRRLTEYLLAHEERFADELYSIREAKEKAIRALSTETAEATTKDWMKAYSALFGGLSKMFAVAGREHRAFFLLSRKMALVQAGINTALAITNALANVPAPANFVKAAATGIKGAAQKARIISSMVPSAETGGRFIVPPSRGVDSGIMRVNPGEQIDVTPRGMTGGETARYIFRIGEQTIFDIVNRGGRAGDINAFEPAANL